MERALQDPHAKRTIRTEPRPIAARGLSDRRSINGHSADVRDGTLSEQHVGSRILNVKPSSDRSGPRVPRY